jgi:phasin
MTNSNKSHGDHLTKAYREIGIKAVAATVKSNQQNDGSDEAQTDLGQTKQGQESMSEQAKRFSERTTKAARENIERSASATEDATRNVEQSYSSTLAGMRQLNLKLIEMAHANSDAVFDLAHKIASAKSPSDLANIWTEHARRQFELMTTQSKELAELGQTLAGQTTEPLARTVNEALARGT